MKLRTRTMLAVGLSLLAGGTATMAVSYLVFTRTLQTSVDRVLRSLREEETERVDAALRSAVARLAKDRDDLTELVTAWGRRDDTYAYMENRSASYRRASLADAVMEQHRLSALVLTTTTGQVVDWLCYDRVRGVFRDLPASIPALLQPGGSIGNVPTPRAGIHRLPEGAFLWAASPIVPGSYRALSRGTYLIGRFLDQAQALDLEAEVRAPVALLEPGVSQMPDGVTVLDELTVGQQTLADEAGQPVAVVRVTAGPAASQSAVAVLQSFRANTLMHTVWLAAALLGTLVVVTGSALIVVEGGVARRVGLLARRLEAIASDPRVGERVTSHGDDEIGLLETSINEVLAAMDTTRRSQYGRASSEGAAARRCRAALQATGMIAFELETGSGRRHLEGAVTRLTGYMAGELESVPAETWHGLIHTQDRPAAAAAPSPDSSTPYRVQYRLRKRDGAWVTLEERGIRVSTAADRIVGIIRMAPRGPRGQ